MLALIVHYVMITSTGKADGITKDGACWASLTLVGPLARFARAVTLYTGAYIVIKISSCLTLALSSCS